MKLTNRGWSALGSAVGLYGLGRALGTVELVVLSAACILAVVVGGAVTLLSRPRVSAQRTLHPPRLHAGTEGRADIEVRNRHPSRRTPVLSVTDTFGSSRRRARFTLPPFAPGGRSRGAYRVPTRRRGVFALGPLTVSVTDPLALVRRVVWSGPEETVTVLPRVAQVMALPPAAGSDLVGGVSNVYSQSRTGQEFHSLREYTVGDDLRRVHWRSTARTGELMIREHDVPWQLRVTVLLDDRFQAFQGADFEGAVEAAASIVTAVHSQRAITRLVTTTGVEVGFGAGHEHTQQVLERLAVVGLNVNDRFEAVTGRLHRSAAGALVVVTADPPDAELLRLATLGRRYGSLAVVRFLRGSAPPRGRAYPGTVPVDVRPPATFAGVWNRTFVGAGR